MNTLEIFSFIFALFFVAIGVFTIKDFTKFIEELSGGKFILLITIVAVFFCSTSLVKTLAPNNFGFGLFVLLMIYLSGGFLFYKYVLEQKGKDN